MRLNRALDRRTEGTTSWREVWLRQVATGQEAAVLASHSRCPASSGTEIVRHRCPKNAADWLYTLISGSGQARHRDGFG